MIVIFLIIAVNYLIDPYGYNSKDSKFIKNLTMFNKPHVTAARINSKGFYYLIGSSRMARVNPLLIETITDKITHNIKIDGATLAENLELAKKVKIEGKFFIYSFDAFSLNNSREKFRELENRLLTYKKELNRKRFFTKYFNSDISIRSIQHLIKSSKSENLLKQFDEENSRSDMFYYDLALNNSGINNNVDKANFSNYQTYSRDEIIKLANLGTKDDIFIIFPKYVSFYSLFSNFQDIQNKYLTAIRSLVLHTDAEVWSFYGVNELTKETNNFIDNGWHFKPKVSNIIFEEVFNNDESRPNKNGVLLTKENIDDYLNSIKSNVENLSLN